MDDIGIVEYKLDSDNNRIIADWHYLKEGRIVAGTGIASGKSINGFAGEYNVTYYSLAGKEISKFNLNITPKGNCFELTWSSEGKKIYCGIGIKKNGKLYAGWKRC